MSRIHVREDVPRVLQNALREGLVHRDEFSGVEERVRWIVNHPALASSFGPGWKVKTEASLIVPDGSERRIDRFAERTNEAMLIDYKTGVPSARDEEQVREYLQLLRTMGVEKVQGFLVYLNDQLCKEVTV